jgi:hypothetical protein
VSTTFNRWNDATKLAVFLNRLSLIHGDVLTFGGRPAVPHWFARLGERIIALSGSKAQKKNAKTWPF